MRKQRRRASRPNVQQVGARQEDAPLFRQRLESAAPRRYCETGDRVWDYEVIPAERLGYALERVSLAHGRGDRPPAPGSGVLLRVRERPCVEGYYAHVCYKVTAVGVLAQMELWGGESRAHLI